MYVYRPKWLLLSQLTLIDANLFLVSFDFEDRIAVSKNGGKCPGVCFLSSYDIFLLYRHWVLTRHLLTLLEFEV